MSAEAKFDFDSPRQFDVIPSDDRVQQMLIVELRSALALSWGPETCAEWERDLWKSEVPAFGQCAVTTLVVQDILGGKIVKDPDNDHYWNVLDDGSEVDLTRSQFPIGVVLSAKLERTREYMLQSERSIAAKTPERYTTLRERVRKLFGR
jgi:hypothetical protein